MRVSKEELRQMQKNTVLTGRVGRRGTQVDFLFAAYKEENDVVLGVASLLGNCNSKVVIPGALVKRPTKN